MNSNERHIIMRVLSGKTDDFSYFLDTYGQQVFTLIVSMVGSPEDAEELTQDTFMKAFDKLNSFREDSSFSTWIYRIAYNTALSALRKKKKIEEMTVIDDKQWDAVNDEEVNNALDDSSEERIEELQRALKKLTAEEQALIDLYYEKEKNVAEIAVITKQTEGNVKVKLYRIRKKLYILITEEEKS